MTALAFDRVSYSYPAADGRPGAPAMEEVSFTLDPGEFCLVAGLSASGKSTLLRAACGLVPHFHGGKFAGRVTVGGLDTREHGPAEVAAVAGTLLQDPETQILMGTVRAELAFPLENRGYGAAGVARGVEEAALALGIERLLDRSTAELSGGEQQRVALAAALAGRPAVVLLDEPTSQLDPVAADELICVLRRLNEEWGTTILLVEHRLERCLQAADRVLALTAGRLVCDARPGEFLDWAAASAPPLLTPAATLLRRVGLRPAPAGVKEARTTLRAHGLLPAPSSPAAESASRPARPQRGRRRRTDQAALHFDGVWHELANGPAILRGVDLEIAAGETVALMGRNGAGKSTLLRHAHGLLTPTRGRVARAGRVALLLQNPGDYFLAERVADELAPRALADAGLSRLAERDPRDLSGGERQRLALAIVCAGDPPPAVVCLDEPTRGMDREAKVVLSDLMRAAALGGSAVVIATHDTEFAATFAKRVVMLADGRVIADAPAADVLSGGWYFATETARILGGAGGALLPEQGAEFLLSGQKAGAVA